MRPAPHPLTVIAASALAGALAAAPASAQDDAAVPDTTSADERPSDARLDARLHTLIALNPILGEMLVDVRVDSGVAHLSGHVTNDAERRLASDVALSVEGIDDVDNTITIRHDFARNVQLPQIAWKVRDATIAATVRSRLAWNRHTRGAAIDVDVRHSIVNLTGTVANAEARDWAVRLARDTHDASEVIATLEVGGEDAAPEAGDGALQDSRIASRVRRNLGYSRRIASDLVDVSAVNGKVLISGAIPREYQLGEIEEQSRAVFGVKDVEIDLEVRGVGTAS